MFEDTAPLAERMRPKSLSEIIGQSHLVGSQGIIRNAIISGRIPSIIFWGPPGTGKTTLANIIANELKLPFHVLSAINAGVNSVREVIAKGIPGQKNILFGRTDLRIGGSEAKFGVQADDDARLVAAPPKFHEVSEKLIFRSENFAETNFPASKNEMSGIV